MGFIINMDLESKTVFGTFRISEERKKELNKILGDCLEVACPLQALQKTTRVLTSDEELAYCSFITGGIHRQMVLQEEADKWHFRRRQTNGTSGGGQAKP